MGTLSPRSSRAIVGALCAAALGVGACKRESAPPLPSPLQDGAVTASADAARAVAVLDAAAPPIPPSALKVVVGLHASCSVMSDHTVRCWGANDAGQLGDGTLKDSVVPVVPAIRGVQDLVLGADHACALLDDASVACWGKIAFGPKPGPTLVPTGVPGAHDMARVFAVGGAGCSTSKAGALVCWGDVDSRGHVTATGGRRTPTAVPGVDHIAALVERAALRDDGDIALWLDNGAPTRAGITGATEVAMRDGAACALGGDGLVRCWGTPAPCAVAAPAVAPAPSPPAPRHRGRGHGPRKAALVAQAAKKAAAKAAAEAAAPDAGSQAGSGSAAGPSGSTTAAKPLPLALAFGAKVAHLAFDAGLCAITSAKQLVCLDDRAVGNGGAAGSGSAASTGCKLARPWPALVAVAEVAGTCARLAAGTVRCAGSGAAAPLIDNIAGAAQISARAGRGCAVLADGGIACWVGTDAATRL